MSRNEKIVQNEEINVYSLENGQLYINSNTGEWCLCEKNSSFNHHTLNNRKFLDINSYKLENLQIRVTNQCNLKCRYCSVDAKEKNFQFLPIKTIKEVIMESLPLGVREISITGGEPFYYKELNELLRFFRNFSYIIIVISTNGMNITEEQIQLLTNIPNLIISVSLDSLDPEKNSCLRLFSNSITIKRNILKLIQNGIDVSISTVITKNNMNINELEDLILWSINLGLKRHHFIFAQQTGRAKRNLSLILNGNEKIKLLEQIIDLSIKYWKNIQISDILELLANIINGCNKACGIGRNRLIIYANGDCFACPFIDTEEYRTGNIFNQSIKEIWNNDPILLYFRSLTVEDIEECNQCDIRYICGGGCRAMALWENSNILSKPSLCQFTSIIKIINHTPKLIKIMRDL